MDTLPNSIIRTNNRNVPALLSTAGNVTNIYSGDAGMSILSKKCSKCGELKDRSEFYKDKRYRDGLYPSCKSCKSAVFASYYAGEGGDKYREKGNKFYHNNRDRQLEIKKARYPEIREQEAKRNRGYYLKSNFGITQERYDEMFKAQGGVCLICGKPETSMSNVGRPKALAVDHDHKTGEVRGLLCNKCNAGIGHFDDNESLLLKAIRYLTRKR